MKKVLVACAAALIAIAVGADSASAAARGGGGRGGGGGGGGGMGGHSFSGGGGRSFIGGGGAVRGVHVGGPRHVSGPRYVSGPRVVSGPRFVSGPRYVSGRRFVGAPVVRHSRVYVAPRFAHRRVVHRGVVIRTGYPFRHYNSCIRWRWVATPVGWQWRRVNVCRIPYRHIGAPHRLYF